MAFIPNVPFVNLDCEKLSVSIHEKSLAKNLRRKRQKYKCEKTNNLRFRVVSERFRRCVTLV